MLKLLSFIGRTRFASSPARGFLLNFDLTRLQLDAARSPWPHTKHKHTQKKKPKHRYWETERERKNLHIAICHGPKTRRILKNELSSKNYGDRSNKKKLARRIYAWKSQRKPMKASKIIIIIEVVKVKWEILTIDLLICISILELKWKSMHINLLLKELFFLWQETCTSRFYLLISLFKLRLIIKNSFWCIFILLVCFTRLIKKHLIRF